MKRRANNRFPQRASAVRTVIFFLCCAAAATASLSAQEPSSSSSSASTSSSSSAREGEEHPDTPSDAAVVLPPISLRPVQPDTLETVYPDRKSGDEAFRSGDYAVAASFYAKYRENARKKQDSSAGRDAFEREIDSLILAFLPDEAEKTLQDFEMEYPGVNSLSVSMWKADILLLRRKPSEAKVILERILPGFTSLDPRRIRVLSSLAFALELLHENAEAAKNYSFIYNTAGNSAIGHSAFERMILNQIASGDIPKAKEMLLSFPAPEGKRDEEALKLLNLYLLLKEKGPDSISSASLGGGGGRGGDGEEDLSGEENSGERRKREKEFFFIVYSLIGDECTQGGADELALEAYRRAFDSAPLRKDAFDSLDRILALLDRKTDNPGQAADLAMKQYELFQGAYATAETKLRAARLLANAGREAPALDLYRAVFSDHSNSVSLRKKALNEALSVLSEKGRFSEAASLVREYFRTTKDSGGEADFLLAELLLREGRYADAAAAYRKTAEMFPAFRDRALYQSAYSSFQGKDWDQAMKSISELLSDPKASDSLKKDALYLRALTHASAGRKKEAALDYSAYVDRKSGDADKTVNALYEAGRIFFEERDFASAERFFARLVKEYPDHILSPCAHFWLIHVCYVQGKELEAERQTWLLSEKHPDSEYALRALFRLASHYAESGAGEKASGTLSSLAKRGEFPEIQAKALYEKALLAYHTENYQEAETLIGELEERFPSSSLIPEAYYLMGDLRRAVSDFENAVLYYEKAAQRRPSSLLEYAALGAAGDVRFAMASKADDPSKYHAALSLYEILLSREDLPPRFRAMALYRKGRCLQLMNLDEEALKCYRELLYQLPPDEASRRPGERLWCVKAVENMVDIASQRPLSMNIESALTGLKWLSGAGIQDPGIVAERMKRIKRLRFSL